MDQPMTREEMQELAYKSGYDAAARGEEARPGCPIDAHGRAWMRGYIAGAAA